jgi:hypothetical protein
MRAHFEWNDVDLARIALSPCGTVEGGTGRRPHARPTAAGEAGGFNAVQKLLTARARQGKAGLSCLG